MQWNLDSDLNFYCVRPSKTKTQCFAALEIQNFLLESSELDQVLAQCGHLWVGQALRTGSCHSTIFGLAWTCTTQIFGRAWTNATQSFSPAQTSAPHSSNARNVHIVIFWNFVNKNMLKIIILVHRNNIFWTLKLLEITWHSLKMIN